MDYINTEDFISEIKKQIAIWDTGAEDYSDKTKKQNAWDDVIRKFCTNFDDKTQAEKQAMAIAYQKKWKSLRTCYTRELAKIRNTKSGSATVQRKKYVYFDLMGFLQSASKPTMSTFDEEADSQSDGSEDEIQDNTPTEENRKSSKRKKRGPNSNEHEALLHSLKDKYSSKLSEDDTDEDRLFLLSLVPYFKKLPEEVRLDLKGDIFSMLRRAMRLNQQQLDPPSSHTPQMHYQNDYQQNSDKSNNHTPYPFPYHPALAQQYPQPQTANYQYPTYGVPAVNIHVPVTLHQCPSQTPSMTPTGTGQNQASGTTAMNRQTFDETQASSFGNNASGAD